MQRYRTGGFGPVNGLSSGAGKRLNSGSFEDADHGLAIAAFIDDGEVRPGRELGGGALLDYAQRTGNEPAAGLCRFQGAPSPSPLP